MKKALYGLSLILYSSLNYAQEICTPIQIGEEDKFFYSNQISQSMTNSPQFPKDGRVILKKPLKVEQCYTNSENTKLIDLDESFKFVKGELEQHLGKLLNDYSLERTFSFKDIEILTVQTLYHKISQSSRILSDDGNNTIELTGKIQINNSAESNLVLSNQDNSISITSSRIYLSENSIQSENQLYISLFAEMLHQELRGATIRTISETNGNIQNAVKLEEAIVHNIVFDWAKEMARNDPSKFNQQTIQIDLENSIMDTPRYSWFGILQNALFSSNSGLKLRKKVLKEYRTNPIRWHRTFVEKEK